MRLVTEGDDAPLLTTKTALRVCTVNLPAVRNFHKCVTFFSFRKFTVAPQVCAPLVSKPLPALGEAPSTVSDNGGV